MRWWSLVFLWLINTHFFLRGRLGALLIFFFDIAPFTFKVESWCSLYHFQKLIISFHIFIYPTSRWWCVTHIKTISFLLGREISWGRLWKWKTLLLHLFLQLLISNLPFKKMHYRALHEISWTFCHHCFIQEVSKSISTPHYNNLLATDLEILNLNCFKLLCKGIELKWDIETLGIIFYPMPYLFNPLCRSKARLWKINPSNPKLGRPTRPSWETLYEWRPWETIENTKINNMEPLCFLSCFCDCLIGEEIKYFFFYLKKGTLQEVGGKLLKNG